MAADDAGLAGQLIASRYRIGNHIGEGGMGVVYAAFDEQLRRQIAVKLLPSASQADGDSLGRFRNEARTLSALNHPHIVTIFEIGQTEATPFIAMELVEGETLRARLRAGRLPLRDAVDIALQVARALGAAHEKVGDMTFVDYVIKSGRAVIYPVYQKLYERRSATVTLPGPTLQRAVLVDWRKDVGRSIDYLETRDDIDKNRIGYLGVSQGAAYGVVVAALEDRLKAVVLLDGGMFQQTSALAGLDQVDFAPRLTKPVLMVNGRYDATFPYESAQLPLFRMLGTAAVDKRHVVFDTPHDVRLRRTDLVREVLDWYDTYLGKVQ